MNAYNNFAKLYDTLMDNVDYNRWYKYIKEILNKYRYEPKTVLEMACGTGSLTKFLCEDDYDITCFDLSEEMLSVAYDKLRKYKNCEILNQDMTNFDLNKKYDLILCLCDSLNYITDREDLINTFNNVYNHLNEDGMFIFDINSYYKLNNIIANNTFVEDREEIYYIWDNFYDDENDQCEFYLTFFVKEAEKYLRFDENHIQKAYKTNEIIEVLKSSEFKNIDVYEGFTFNSINETSERINFIATK
ncbi:MAG: class I SAM-dependent methyltransferase [Firmicutes bacterium]|nr:class I SAM-dependent methyltransferase [Bacillota bacterium]